MAWAGQAAAELARVNLRPAAPGELTETERRVAELAAAGLTNREVAQRLFLAVKTVEANLARVYRKLAHHVPGGARRPDGTAAPLTALAGLAASLALVPRSRVSPDSSPPPAPLTSGQRHGHGAGH